MLLLLLMMIMMMMMIIIIIIMLTPVAPLHMWSGDVIGRVRHLGYHLVLRRPLRFPHDRHRVSGRVALVSMSCPLVLLSPADTHPDHFRHPPWAQATLLSYDALYAFPIARLASPTLS
jgi:hypothetical protein